MIDNTTSWTWEDFSWTECNGAAHAYPVYLNHGTKEYFNGDRVAIITAKCAGLIFARPLHTAYKTLYHILILPIMLLRDPGSLTNHLIDIVLTPIYGIILTALAIVGLVLGLFGSEKIYDLRLLMGKIEQSLNRGEKYTSLTLAPCFQPGDLNSIDTVWGEKRFEDTRYASEQGGRTNYARAKIIHNRNFNCLLPQGQAQTPQVS